MCLRLARDVSPLSGHSRPLQRKLSRFTAPLFRSPWPTSRVAFQALHMDEATPSGASCGPASQNSYQNRYFGYEQRDGSFTPPKHVPYTNKTVTGGRKTFHQWRRQGKYQAYHLHIHGGNREGKRSPEVHSPFLNQGLIQAVMASWCLSEPRPIHSGITTKNKSEPGQGFPAFPVPLGGTMLMCIS